jgi:hypothetical protein
MQVHKFHKVDLDKGYGYFYRRGKVFRYPLNKEEKEYYLDPKNNGPDESS